ncbi:MAG: sugar phosphate isomerase/epimerase family protein [Planctomycetota bacterium]
MRIGLSVTCRQLLPAPVVEDGNDRVATLGDADLARLRSAGFEILELKTYGCDRLELPAGLDAAQAAGFTVQFHREIQFPGHARYCVDGYTRFLDTCRAQGIPHPLVVVHGTDGCCLSGVEHRQASAEMLSVLARGFPDITFALELNRRRRRVAQACDSYEATQRVLDRLPFPNVGFCWDVGHAYANVEVHGDPLVPPADLMDRLCSLHLHAFRDGETHHPLGDGALPVEEVASALTTVAYEGPVVLEVRPRRVGNAATYLDAIISDADLCRHALGAAPADFASAV